MDQIYASVSELEKLGGKRIDLVVCCGDFQSVRNIDDLECMACPVKYRALGSFYKYYSGEKVAPYPTVFIGGNHEAINYLKELYYGGWVAPNIYFLGYSGVIRFGGIRIAGLSGIYKKQHYLLGHYEVPPYSDGSLRSAYHVRSIEVQKLMGLSHGEVDVFLSHDWPSGITSFGDQNGLLRRKRFLANDIQHNNLGSPPSMALLKKLEPAYWFSAHLHTKFAAMVPHASGRVTRFLSLDKCLPGRDYLQVIDFPEVHGPKEFMYDAEWLAIIKKTHTSVQYCRNPVAPPAPVYCTQEEMEEITRRFNGNLEIPKNFEITAPAAGSHNRNEGVAGQARGFSRGSMPTRILQNRQMDELMEKLDIKNINVPPVTSLAEMNANLVNPESIDIESDDEVDPAVQAVLLH